MVDRYGIQGIWQCKLKYKKEYRDMEKRKVEFEINPTRTMGWIATILGILTAGYAMASWIDDAGESHVKTDSHAVQLTEFPPEKANEDIDDLTIIVKQLKVQEDINRKLWGPAYEKKIMELIDIRDQQKQLNDDATGSE